jgi:hypothetical protein
MPAYLLDYYCYFYRNLLSGGDDCVLWIKNNKSLSRTAESSSGKPLIKYYDTDLEEIEYSRSVYRMFLFKFTGQFLSAYGAIEDEQEVINKDEKKDTYIDEVHHKVTEHSGPAHGEEENHDHEAPAHVGVFPLVKPKDEHLSRFPKVSTLTRQSFFSKNKFENIAPDRNR